MKLSTNFVKDYVAIPEKIDLKQLAEDMTRVGNEYDSAEKLINVTNVTIGEVKTCEMHPDSDHLHVCTVDVGNEILDIVCGAPNVRAGLKVIVVPVLPLPNGSGFLSKDILIPSSKYIVAQTSSLLEETIKNSERAFVALAPTPFIPPDVLYPVLPELSNFAPVCNFVKIFSNVSVPSSAGPKGTPRPLSEILITSSFDTSI